MTIEQDLSRLLQDRLLHEISFSIAGRSVLGRAMPRVAEAISRGQWTVQVDPTAPSAWICIDRRHMVLTHGRPIGTAAVYEALHECTHVMLVLTGVDRAGMGVLVEIAATLLPIIYLFKTHPVEARSGRLFAQTSAASAFVDVVRDNHMHDTSVQLSQADVQMLFRHASVARRQEMR